MKRTPQRSIVGGEWRGDLLHLNGVPFHVDYMPEAKHPEGTLALRKTRPLIERQADFFERQGCHPARIVELGTAEGGSAAFWFEHFQPDKLVTIDILEGASRPAFDRYLRDAKGLHAYWGVDQGDASRLAEIVAKEFDGPIDLVLDDASHLYEPTRASFEVLFPLLCPGGFYVLEDWDWEILPKFERPDAWVGKRGLLGLVEELLCRVGKDVLSLSLYRGFAAVERA